MIISRSELNTLRGLACIFLVAFHVVGFDSSSGLKISEGLVRVFNDALGYVRMPLFTFLSGFVYAYRPFTSGVKAFLLKKSRRLLLPMFVVGTIFVILQMLIPNTNGSISKWYLIHIIPVGHFWFVESLFLIFLMITFLELIGSLSTFIGFFIVFIISSMVFLSSINIPYFSISGAIYLFPFFIFGMAVNRYSLFKVRLRFVRVIPILIVFFILFYILDGTIDAQEGRSFFSLLLGCLSCVSLYLLKPNVRLLSWVGTFSYSIYLFHVFFTAGSRILLQGVGVSNLFIFFFISLILGLVGPIFCEIILSRYKYTRLFFLGKPSEGGFNNKNYK